MSDKQIIIQKIGVIGAGQMGRGIAQIAAMSEFKVILYDISSHYLEEGKKFIELQMQRGVDKGKWERDYCDKVLGRMQYSSELSALSSCQLVIEAATEEKKIKFEIFRTLDKLLPPNGLIVTNTSSISITEIAAVTSRPQKIAGMHFMNPVPVMKLVEGICGLETTEETMDIVAAVAKKMGKTFVRVRDIPGFAVNRILMPMINEAIYVLYEGIANREDIDLAMKLGTNMPMGPLELADFIGLDTCLSILEIMYDGLGDPKYRPCPLLKTYVAAKRFGRKSKKGFYEYSV